ncbi:hypothetical protein DMX03_10490 [Pseudomonas koreensis]|nr:hypothetical protein DMX03_10490 [Pseudomonas koreensis]
MDKWIELVKAKMSELKVTQTELGERVGMSQGGDSMTAPSGQSVAEGMLILVDPELEAVPGKLVIAQWPDSEEAIFRKLDEQAGQRYLVPLNPTWPKTLLTDECRIIGVVVQATARY